MLMAYTGVLLLAACAAVPAAAEQSVSVILWNSGSNVATQGGSAPRYVIGSVNIGGQSQHFTFDAGNAKEPLLLAEGCLGCGDGCPSTVESCSHGGQACWSSHPHDFAPSSSYSNSGQNCPSGVSSAGSLHGTPVCMQCFGGSSHSRFYTMAVADATIDNLSIKNLEFGALVRTAPATDRVWSNVGIGYKSHFLRQIGASSILLHLRVGKSSSVIFNPSSSRYAGAQSASFSVGSNREHSMDRMVIGSHNVNFGRATFHIDTGNSGISISDSSLLSQLQSAAHGLTPSTAPDLVIVLDGMSVAVPGNVWVNGHSSTIFSAYHKNVLGLPFITSADIIFDDSAKRMYIASSSPAPSPTPSPSPAPSPTCRRRRCRPPSPPPSSCVTACAGQCDCECFCSCGAVCGDGCYGQCKSGSWAHSSCSGHCPQGLMTHMEGNFSLV